MGASGLRSSCASIARNSSFDWLSRCTLVSVLMSVTISVRCSSSSTVTWLHRDVDVQRRLRRAASRHVRSVPAPARTSASSAAWSSAVDEPVDGRPDHLFERHVHQPREAAVGVDDRALHGQRDGPLVHLFDQRAVWRIGAAQRVDPLAAPVARSAARRPRRSGSRCSVSSASARRARSASSSPDAIVTMQRRRPWPSARGEGPGPAALARCWTGRR